MTIPQTLVIVNPASQNSALGKRWPQLSKTLRRHIGSFEHSFTEARGDAIKLCRDALASGSERIIAVGGDGTINEVSNGFFDEEGVPSAPAKAHLGILPFGTGGDFRKSLNIPKDAEGAAEILAAGKQKEIDAGRLRLSTRDGGSRTRIFVNIASMGISGEIVEEVNRRSKRLGGKVTFFLATAKAGMSYQTKRVRLVFDGKDAEAVESDIQTVAVCNGQYFGGGMRIAPEAALDDGAFDVVAVEEMGSFESFRHTPKLYKGTHLGLDKVSHRRAKEVRAESCNEREVLLDVDGEMLGMLPAHFQIIPKALKVLVP